ncbi:hypothetical protein FPH17_11815 [Corynebacterium godavarianum]|uniref:Uncharacterized protein n=1 Tax=Corynebacterium godavarianum TaxID=2054421 RepID=A0ABY3DXQ8_9CORY|nr:hypothetical protein [Corynebacterium godavarianum]MBL7286381.1 hypothetical protein [Corynebacterium godavarianum]TSJ69920.1 hypothetical protein FPH17_11815 [Corynebacterium godavarianum]
MKNTLLSLGVASAVAVTAVCPAYAAEPAQESSSLSPGAIAGISLGVLALVGAGSYFAVSQGLIDVPGLEIPEVPGLGELAALAGAAGIAIPALGAGAAKGGDAKAASCQPGAFDQLVPGWPNHTGTSVDYCDGKWAVAGANQTDWIVAFRADGEQWHVVEPDGKTETGFKCYNTGRLREQGAPQEFTDKLLTCAA